MKAIKGKIVRLKKQFFDEGLDADYHLFRCEKGLGCFFSRGPIYGTFLSDGERCKISRTDVEAVAATVVYERGEDNEHFVRVANFE